MRAAGAVPATIGVLDGEIVVGLTEDELARFDAVARKVGPRDLARRGRAARGRRDDGRRHARGRARGRHPLAWRPAGSAACTAAFPIRPTCPPTSAQLARTPALVVSAGVKSLLDVPATSELLESLGVPVLGFRVDTLPLFYAAAGGPPVSARVESADEAARVARAHWELGGGGLLLGRPPDEPLDDVEPLIEQALRAAHDAGRQRPGGDAVRPLLSPPRERRPHAAREQGSDRAERAPRRRDRVAATGSAARTLTSASASDDHEVADRPDADRPSRARTRRRTARAEQEAGEPGRAAR